MSCHMFMYKMQHAATHCNMHCNVLHCNTGGDLRMKVKNNRQTVTNPHTTTHSNTLQHTATHCNMHCNTGRYLRMQVKSNRQTVTTLHTAAHCNILQHAAMYTATRGGTLACTSSRARNRP